VTLGTPAHPGALLRVGNEERFLKPFRTPLRQPPITSDYVAGQTDAALEASYGRTQQSATLQIPGLMVA